MGPQFPWPVRGAIEAANDNDRNMWAIRDAVNFAYNGDPIQRVLYTENHDEVANGRSRVRNHLAGQRGRLLLRSDPPLAGPWS